VLVGLLFKFLLGFHFFLQSWLVFHPLILPSMVWPKTRIVRFYKMHGFISAPSHCWLKKLSTKTELLPTQKSSTKLISKLTHGFISAHSPCWLRSRQRQLCRCWFKNRQWKTMSLPIQKSIMKTVSLPIKKSAAMVESFLALPLFLLGDYNIWKYKCLNL
jgi:hypothetical protein